ncbi:hypothetical protein L5I01_17325 [Gordonia sp. HY442]|uniref:hypothetical protein n=1 Tax=Gordonia zhenghanii TaxID=2911516 RepID=UPI001F317E8A|nr:hypothetical protein [Gordonia zhenghanii]MCF8605118.1 hypothetical protein [Gordonia zhenghanii]
MSIELFCALVSLAAAAVTFALVVHQKHLEKADAAATFAEQLDNEIANLPEGPRSFADAARYADLWILVGQHPDRESGVLSIKIGMRSEDVDREHVAHCLEDAAERIRIEGVQP